MASSALAGLTQGLEEVRALQRANPTPTGSAPALPQVTRAIGRASVVILSSHLERYLYAVNEEACDALNGHGVNGGLFPESLRLLHTRQRIDYLGDTQWTERAAHLAAFVMEESWLWGATPTTGLLDHKRLLSWMKSPKPDAILRYYKYWGIEDIFKEITRTAHNRAFLRLKLGELVDKRNNIAHGEFIEQATAADVRSYVRAVRTFCTSADRALARALQRAFAIPRPWI